MTGANRAAGWFVVWLLALALLYAHVATHLRLSGDLRLFLPEPTTPEQGLVLEGIGEGPASRLLLIALTGADQTTLAEASHSLIEGLRDHPSFRGIHNGATTTIPEVVTRYRYLLSPAMDQRPLDATTLRAALNDRLQDLLSPAAPLIEPLMASDPTLEVLSIAESWAPFRSPQIIDDAWFDTAGERALLVAQTRAAGFDPDGQQQAFSALESEFRKLAAGTGMRMIVTGPGRFSALMKERTQREATWLGSIATAGLLLLLFVAYRKPRILILAALPLASAALAGLACVSLLYGEVHGITLAFGFTLIGVAQDYPIHLFSHQHRGLDPFANARKLWPTLATGVASTCIAYLAFLTSGVTGLAQLAWFTIAGLAVAGLTTRYLLPRVAGGEFDDTAEARYLDRIETVLTLPALRPLAYAIAAGACLAAIFLARGAFWENDLGALTPVPRELLAEDAALRRELGAPDARYLAVITAESAERALERLEAAAPGLDRLVAEGAVAGVDHAARYLPSMAKQRQRQSSLPDAAALAESLKRAQQDLPYRADAFAPFLAEVARARELAPLEAGGAGDDAMPDLLQGLLHERAGGWAALVAFSGVKNAGRLDEWAATAGGGTVVIDLKRESAMLVIRQRSRILACLAIAALLLVGVVRLSLGSTLRAVRVLAPMLLSTLAVLAVLRVAGQALDLFHLISLVLAAGLGLDYALFFERAGADRKERLRTLHGVLVCALSTLLVFALLSLSSIPVLRSIGTTVALGVFFNFLLALSLPRAERKHAAA
ncbi:MAG: MMPL family transporter [Steroidobacteraceae bacterium]